MREHPHPRELAPVLLSRNSPHSRLTDKGTSEEVPIEGFSAGRLSSRREGSGGSFFSDLRDVSVGFDGYTSHGCSFRTEDSEGTESLEVAEFRVEFVGGDAGWGVAVEEFTVDVVLEDESRGSRRVGVSLSSGEESSSDCGGGVVSGEEGRGGRLDVLA